MAAAAGGRNGERSSYDSLEQVGNQDVKSRKGLAGLAGLTAWVKEHKALTVSGVIVLGLLVVWGLSGEE